MMADIMEGITPTPTPNSTKDAQSSVTVTLPTPHTFDLGNLLCNDPNPLPHNPTPTDIQNTARTVAQSLINQLLTTCPIHTSSNASDASVLMTLPPCTTPLPREKPLPKEKEKTKWEKFAAKKGIKDKSREGGKMVFDEEKGEWVPKWGYKGKGGGDEEWIVEVDDKKSGGEKGKEAGGEGRFGGDRREKKENMRRNERKMRANERKERKTGNSR